MLLTKKKIKLIHELFNLPYKPSLINIENEKEEMIKLSQIKTPINLSQTIKNKSTNKIYKKSSFPAYDIKTISSNNNYNTINYNTIEDTFPHDYFLRKEIIIRNPEEIIESGIIKSSVRKEGVSSIYENLNMDIKFPENQIGPRPNNIPNEQPLDMEPNNNEFLSQQQNLEDVKNIEEPVNDIDKIIPGPLTETVKLDENVIEETNEAPVIEATNEKKYKINSGNIVSLPENYSTDDQDENIAVNTLNEDISSWKKYTDKNGIKLYFKPYPVKDEEGKDVESVIGYCEAILDFPAGQVIQKMNNFEFRKNVDDQYKKGNLISEKMDMYLFMKMPFIFSDRDFVVRKKCWLDYNGNKDHALFYIHSIENSEYPPKKKLVRGTFENRSGYIKPLGDNKCQLNVVTAMDVKMSLGVSTMSKNGAEMQEKWIDNLRKELAK